MLFLETLPGWPEAPEYSAMYMWTLMILGPVLAFVTIIVLVWAPKWVARNRSAESTEVVLKSEE